MASKSKNKQGVTVAKTDDGTVQMTFVISWAEVEKAEKEATTKLSSTVTVPGFRAGKAPVETAASHIPRETLVQETVTSLLPAMISQAYKDHDITPIMYPKLELLHAHDGEDWEIRATTAQFPEIKMGDYKEKIKGAIATNSIWTPEKGKVEEQKEMSPEEKENIALRTILETVEVNLPNILVEEEADHRVANLLARLEKLGLSLESYLASQSKDVQTVRAEYAQAARESLKLELVLGKVAEEEKIVVDEKEVDAFAKVTEADPRRAGQPVTPEERNTIRTLLLKRKAIDKLVS